jgi:formate-dependent phosphoribosylglycinamide formyltransferase (GAR transformylase)
MTEVHLAAAEADPAAAGHHDRVIVEGIVHQASRIAMLV